MQADTEALGHRIAAARQESGLTQEDLAASASLDRSALAKIETGRRRISALELGRVAEVLDRRIEWFLEEPPPAVISRRSAAAPGLPSPVIDRLAERIAREVEFVDELGSGLHLAVAPSAEPPTSNRAADELAGQFRLALGYDPSEPALELARHASRVGLLVFSFALGDEAADGASILLANGGIAIVNGSRLVGRRRLTLAHELGHFFVADEFSVDWRVAEETAGEREAHLDRFARALLLPAVSLGETWSSHRDGDHDVRTAAVLVGSQFQVDMATLARRLQETGLISSKEADVVRQARTTRADIVDFDLLIPQELAPPTLPREFEEAVLQMYRSELVSAERAVELLFDSWDEGDLPELPRLPEQAIWKFVS